jgi:hypothetical protein
VRSFAVLKTSRRGREFEQWMTAARFLDDAR